MAKLSFQCVLPYNTVASYLVPLLQLNLAGWNRLSSRSEETGQAYHLDGHVPVL
jgi:hypothetical protein